MLATANPEEQFENWDKKSEAIQAEEQEKQDTIIEEFRSSEDYKKLEDEIGQHQDILDSIVYQYSKNGQDIQGAIEYTFLDPISLQKLGLEFEDSQNQKTIATLMSAIWEVPVWNKTQTDIFLEETPNNISEESNSLEKEPQEAIESSPEKESRESHIEEVPGFPSIERLVDTGHISPEEFANIRTDLEWNTAPQTAITNNISDAWKSQEAIKLLEWGKTPEERSESFFADMPKEAANNKEDPVTELIAENYRAFPLKWWEESDKNIDFIIAAREAGNKVIEGKHLPKSETFEATLKTLQTSTDKWEVYLALKYIHKEVNTYQAARSKKLKEQNSKAKKGSGLEKQKTTFAELIERAKANADKKQEQRIKEVMQAQMLEKKDTIETGEGGMWGDILDMLWDISPSSSEKKSA